MGGVTWLWWARHTEKSPAPTARSQSFSSCTLQLRCCPLSAVGSTPSCTPARRPPQPSAPTRQKTVRDSVSPNKNRRDRDGKGPRCLSPKPSRGNTHTRCHSRSAAHRSPSVQLVSVLQFLHLEVAKWLEPPGKRWCCGGAVRAVLRPCSAATGFLSVAVRRRRRRQGRRASRSRASMMISATATTAATSRGRARARGCKPSIAHRFCARTEVQLCLPCVHATPPLRLTCLVAGLGPARLIRVREQRHLCVACQRRYL